MKTLPYTEGSVFYVPLRTGGFARGVVARAAPRGRILFGFFFGPRYAVKPARPFDNLNPADAVLQARFGDLGLINGKWEICGRLPDWSRSDWRIPEFVRISPGLPPQMVRYSDDDPSREEGVHFVKTVDSRVPKDGSLGYGAVEIRLAKLL